MNGKNLSWTSSHWKDKKYFTDAASLARFYFTFYATSNNNQSSKSIWVVVVFGVKRFLFFCSVLMMILIPHFMAVALLFMGLLMTVMFVFFLFRVVVLDWNFNNERLHIKLVWNLFEDVDFIWNSNFFYHWHFNFLNDGILLDVVMVNGVNSLWLFMLHLAVKVSMWKCPLNSLINKNLLLFFFAAVNRCKQHWEDDKVL